MDYPRLIEASAKNYLYNTLQQCHNNRVVLYYYALNISVLILMVTVTASVLYYCNKNKPSEYERRQKLLRDQQYVLSKIRYYKEDKQTTQDSSSTGITTLPITR